MVSPSVCTVTQLVHPAVAGPIVRPLKVMVKGKPGPMPATAVVMTMEVAAGAAEVAVITETEVEPGAFGTGVAVDANNPIG